MENTLPACPSCGSEYTYEDGNLLVCPMCHHEWTREEEEENIEEDVKDAVGNVLSDVDTVTIIKDLKIKGSSNVIKQGTKVKNIRLIDPEDGHDLDCKIPGIGQMNLKSEFVKKI